jgi:ERCC4-type nuclease
MVYLVDTREHENKNTHITDVWDKLGIQWKKKKLDYGDYSFKLP